jgi:cytochrome c biogenesis protein CcdA
MNKKINTVLFVLGATVVNIILMICLALLGLYILSRLPLQQMGGGIRSILMIIVFIGSVVGTFFLYHALIKVISKRIDMDKYFHPIFKKEAKAEGESEDKN